MAGWSEGEVVARGSALHYYRMGSPEKPTVLLLHGFTDSGLCWLRFANDLAADYDVIMTDAVGHGKSGDLSHGFRERAVADVLAVMDALGVERPALVGHSTGLMRECGAERRRGRGRRAGGRRGCGVGGRWRGGRRGAAG